MNFNQQRKSNFLLRLIKFYDDHGLTKCLIVVGILLLLCITVGWVLGGMKSPSLIYAKETIRLIRLDLFGGEQVVPRSIEIYDELQIFYSSEYDSLDILSTSLYVTATNFRDELERIAEKKGGRVRILTLAPTISCAGQQLSFYHLAKAFNQTYDELKSEIFHSFTVLSAIKAHINGNFEVTFYDIPHPQADKNYFIPARSYHIYNQKQPEKRFDILVNYLNPDFQESDSPNRPALRVKNRISNSAVIKQLLVFDEIWLQAKSLDDVYSEMESLDCKYQPSRLIYGK